MKCTGENRHAREKLKQASRLAQVRVSSTSYLVFFYAWEHHHVEFNMPLTA
ncbi:hypothetical protein Pmani_033840 [Petrolisthes manimaculis]|uniref:Uncharacterized protein n=1 Tax=Petrolisthes manimaculis TaxID=1843537 RepID=A0AAE1TS78_9EUCA|nr:hypothetical protein Pmani_033840 [Petrolisthes manimaculis]